MSRSTGRRVSPSDVREWKDAVASANERGSSAGGNGRFVGRLGGGEVGRGIVPHGVSFAASYEEDRWGWETAY